MSNFRIKIRTNQGIVNIALNIILVIVGLLISAVLIGAFTYRSKPSASKPTPRPTSSYPNAF